MKIKLYRNMTDNRYVSKNITFLTEMDFDIKDTVDLIRPTIVLRGGINYTGVNYGFVPEWGRYYYVDKPKIDTSNLIILDMTVDALMSFANGIRSIPALILRQEFVNNQYINDETAPVRTQRVVSYKKIGSLGNGVGYALTVTGGAYEKKEN